MTSIASNTIRRSCRLLGKTVGAQRGQEDGAKKLIDKNNNPTKRIKSEPKTDDVDNISDYNIELNLDERRQVKLDHDTKPSFSPAIRVSESSPKPDGYLEVDSEELDLERTLMGGQSFRWTKELCSDNYLVFTGVLLDNVLKIWRISDSRIAFKKVNKDFGREMSNVGQLLTDYFQLKYNLKQLYQEWSERDEHLAKCCQQYKGFRILRQDPVENVFSFICATNNNIKRISQMVEKLCKRYGDILDNRDDEPARSVYDSYHSFPPVERLAQEDVFQCLRFELGFGYRAKFITESAKDLLKLSQQHQLSQIKEQSEIAEAAANPEPFCSPRDYLLSLRKLPYKETCKQLMRLPGIGRKVADCICLMSMDHLSSVPIDCHIYEIVCRNYMPNLRQERKSLTDSVHDLIGDYFKSLHGNLAGWSTSVLFIAELKHLKMEAEKVGGGKSKQSGKNTAAGSSSPKKKHKPD